MKKTAILVLALAVTVATLGAFWGAGDHPFSSFDDRQYIEENPPVRWGLTWQGAWWAFRSVGYASNWHPLTWLSHMLDVELFGLEPRGHHLVNVAIHAADAALLLLVLRFFTASIWLSAGVAALFALHPLHVESVVWVAERKDVLSTFFWLLVMAAYLRYVRRPGAGRYAAVFLLLAAGLLAKPMLVTLPFVLLLLDYWPLGRMGTGSRRVPVPVCLGSVDSRTRTGTAGAGPVPVCLGSVDSRTRTGTAGAGPVLLRLLAEKVPLLALSAFSAWMTMEAQLSGRAVKALPLVLKIQNALMSYAAYLKKTFWPAGLAVFYPHPGDRLPLWQPLGAALLILGVSALAWAARRRKPWLTVGWFWYLGTLVPVIGLVQAGIQGMADRYTYVPLTGIFLAVVWEAGSLAARRPGAKRALAAASAAILACLWILTRRQTDFWRDDLTLNLHTLAVTSENWLIETNIGEAYYRAGNLDAAIEHFRRAIRIFPRDSRNHLNLGIVLREAGRPEEAKAHFDEAQRLSAYGRTGTPSGR